MICEEGVTRHFMPIAMIEMGIDENRPIAYNNREEFLKSFLELADIKTTTKVPKDSVVLLECRTDIDLVMVLLVENKSGRKVRQI